MRISCGHHKNQIPIFNTLLLLAKKEVKMGEAMKRYSAVAASLLILFFFSLRAQDFNYSAYKKNTIRAIEKMGEEAWNRAKEPGSFQLAMGINKWKYKILVKRNGDFRKISSVSRQCIFFWSRTNGYDKLPPISLEIPVIENRKNYYLPIQDGLVRALEKEVKIGQKMEIYVKYMGYTKEEGPVMLICEFKAL